jgi:chorismate dehydratase
MLRLGITNDADFAPLFFPLEAGWAALPNGIISQTDDPPKLEKALLAGQLDIAPVNPVLYATHTGSLDLLPYPVRAFDLAADSIFLISTKRPDQLEQARVAISPSSQTGEALLKIIAGKYYGLNPKAFSVPTEAAALESLQSQADSCVISGEAAMRAAGWAKAKGYFVEDLTKAWWIMTGLPLPTHLLAVRKEWTRTEPEATTLTRSLMLAFRRALQHSQDQRPTLLGRAADRTGLPTEALDDHYRLQRFELNEAHLRGLLEFYRRAAALGIIPLVEDLSFFPALAPLAAAPAQPPRRSQPEAARPVAAPDRLRKPHRESLPEQAAAEETETEAEAEPAPAPEQPKRSGSRRAAVRAEAQAKGLRVIKGGKDTTASSEAEDEDDS